MSEKTNLKTDSKMNTIVLLVVAAMTFMATLDSSVINIALPVIAKELKISIAEVEWVVVSYSVIICATLLFFGRLGDVVGKTRVFQFGTVLFVVASFLCGISHTFAMLVAFRFLQGIGAAAYMANNHGIIAEIFPVEKRGKALGIVITAVALGNMTGPSVGGIMLSLLDWNFIFFINVPIGIIVFLLGLKYLPKPQRKEERIDVLGAVLQFVGTIMLFTSLTMAQQKGFGNAMISGSLAVSIVVMILFFAVEKKHTQPLLDLEIFENIKFSSNLICAFTSFVCLAASYIVLPFYLQNALNLSPLHAGLFMMLQPLVLAVAAPVFGSISDKVESEKVILIGLLILSGGFLLMSTLTENSYSALCGVFICTIAFGQGVFQPGNNALIMSSCPKSKLGIVGSVNSQVRNLGQIVGITLSTTLLYGFMSKKAGYRVYDYIEDRSDIFIYGMRHVYFVLFLICLCGALVIGIRKVNGSKKEN